MLPIYPAIVILFLKGIDSCLKKIRLPDKKYLTNITYIVVCTAVVLVFFVNYHSMEFNPCGCALEDNLDYEDSLNTYILAMNYIDENYDNEKAILTAWPFTNMLRMPYLGYVKKEHNIVNFDIEKGKEFDLIVFSSQTRVDSIAGLRDFIMQESNNGRIRLVERFQINNRYTEIYEKTE